MDKKISNISVRFLEELAEKGITGYKLMKDGVIKSQTSLTRIKQGLQKPSMKMLNACFQLYGINKSYVLVGEIENSKNENGTIAKDLATTYVQPIKLYLREKLISVPFVPQDSVASFLENLGDMQNMKLDTYGVMQEDGEDLMNGDYVVFQIKGDSMTPNIPDSSKVLAKKVDDAKWEEVNGVVLIAYGKTLTIKRILKNDFYMGGALTLKADNPTYGEVQVSRNEVRGIWSAERIVSQRIK